MGGCVIWFVQFSVVQVGDGRQEGVEEADCLGEKLLQSVAVTT